jgi:hypothetical protein
MRMIKKLFILCFFLVFAASCETYKDYEIAYSPIYPLSGEWLVRYTNTSVTPNVTSALMVMSTFNTADNSSSQMWIRTTSTSTTYFGRFDGKIDCNVAGKSFSGSAVPNTYYTTAAVPTTQTFTITNGTIVTDGYDTATGGKSDLITFTITDTRKPGITYTCRGFRRTRWLDDEV